MLGRSRHLILIALPVLAALAIGLEAARSQEPRNSYQLTSDVTELQCNGDSATLTLKVTNDGSPLASHPVKISFVNGFGFDVDGTITDVATGASGTTTLQGTTDANGEWRVAAAPNPGSMRAVGLFGEPVDNRRGGFGDWVRMDCPFPDDGSHVVSVYAFEDANWNGVEDAAEEAAVDQGINLVPRWAQGLAPQARITTTDADGTIVWDRLDWYGGWFICLDEGSDVQIVSVDGVPLDEPDNCTPTWDRDSRRIYPPDNVVLGLASPEQQHQIRTATATSTPTVTRTSAPTNTPGPSGTPTPRFVPRLSAHVDCDVSTPGIQSECSYPEGTTQVTVAVTFKNITNAALEVSAFDFMLDSEPQSVLNPMPAAGSDYMNANPDFREEGAGVAGTWSCELPAPSHDQLASEDVARSFISCYTSTFVGAPVQPGGSLVAAHVTYASAPGTATLELQDFMSAGDPLGYPIHTGCGFLNNLLLPAICEDATIHIAAPNAAQESAPDSGAPSLAPPADNATQPPPGRVAGEEIAPPAPAIPAADLQSGVLAGRAAPILLPNTGTGNGDGGRSALIALSVLAAAGALVAARAFTRRT